MILVLGATGFLGRRVCKKLTESNNEFVRSSLSLGVDLRNIGDTVKMFSKIKPEIIINCASFVGGIQFGYKYPAELFINNLRMNVNILEAAHKIGIKRIVNPISNCVYPAEAKLFKESEIWNGSMHDSVLVYGFVRKAFWVGSWAFKQQFNLDVINLVLSNMYGPGDHFEEERSHALGALIMKIVVAKKNDLSYVDLWGTGTPIREWLHVDDGAESLIRAMNINPHSEFINVGIAQGISIIEMAEMIKKYVGYKGEIRLDTSKPDGAKHKTVDGTKGEKILGWKPQIKFEEGVKETINWYLNNNANKRDY